MLLLHPISRDSHQGLILLSAAMLMCFLFHGTLLLNESFIHTYDALIHIFFGAHYADMWFDPWEERWYTGFFTVSYPPLSHQSIGFLSHWLGLKPAFMVVQLFAMLNLTFGMYRFAGMFGSRRAAGYATLALVFCSAISETVHLFGQLPTTLSLGFLLHTLPFGRTYLRGGRWVHLLQTVLWMATTTSAHHVTTLFGGVFFMGPMVVTVLLEGLRRPRPNEPKGTTKRAQAMRRLYRLLPRLYRTALFGMGAISVLALVVLPYWLWSFSDPINQVPIHHGSRENFLIERTTGFFFWVVPWASSLWVLLYVAYRGFTTHLWPYAASIFFLALLGTGGTTPIPRMILHGAFDILTLDRFTFWSVMMCQPFIGLFLDSAIHGKFRDWFDQSFYSPIRRCLIMAYALGTISMAMLITSLPNYRKFQPDPIAPAPIVNFIEKDEHWRYRFLTLGFGDQLAWLSANTRATTPDGNYHSARRLPELTTTPVERLESAKYTGVPGIGSLRQFLTYPEKYNLKYIFSNDAFYDPLLYFSGWHSLGQLENGINIWEREDIPPLPERRPRKHVPLYQRIMWGVLPFTVLTLAFTSLLLPDEHTPRLPWQRRGIFKTLYNLLKEDTKHQHTASGWQIWGRFSDWLERRFTPRPRPLWIRILYSSILMGMLIVGAVVVVLPKLSPPPSTVERTVVAYWDHLDFRRFGEAYEMVHPIDGLDFERWMLDFSVVGGLRSQYAKLDSIRIIDTVYNRPKLAEGATPRLGDRAHATGELLWFTALGEITEELSYDLVWTKHGWRIVAKPTLGVRAPYRFASQTAVDYYKPMRRLTTATTNRNEQNDRPKVTIITSRLVKVNPHLSEDAVSDDPETEQHGETLIQKTSAYYSLVGIVHNNATYPADLTITGILRGANQEKITWNNAQTVVIHKLLPDEITPFRIDFTDVSAPEVLEMVEDYEVFTKAVVTTHNLERGLLVVSEVTQDAEGKPVANVKITNTDFAEASIPHVLVSEFDREGVAWVYDAYSMESIPAFTQRELSMPLVRPDGYEIIKEKRENENPAFSENYPHGPPIIRSVDSPYTFYAHAFFRAP